MQKNCLTTLFRLSIVLLIAVAGGCKSMSEQTEKAVNIAQKVHDILQKNVPEDWLPSGIDRNYYLDIIERIVRTAEPWVDNNGAVIDPVLKYEHGQTSPRFASSCAVAIYFGRCTEFKEKLYKVMDHCCYALTQPDAVNRSPNFWMRELVTAYNCLKNIAPPERLKKWKDTLA